MTASSILSVVFIWITISSIWVYLKSWRDEPLCRTQARADGGVTTALVNRMTVSRPRLRPVRYGDDVEHTEDLEIAPVGGRDSLDSRAVVIGGEQGIENAFPAQLMLLHPVDEQRKRALRRLNDATLACLPPLVADLHSVFHRERLGESSWIGHDMRKSPSTCAQIATLDSTPRMPVSKRSRQAAWAGCSRIVRPTRKRVSSPITNRDPASHRAGPQRRSAGEAPGRPSAGGIRTGHRAQANSRQWAAM